MKNHLIVVGLSLVLSTIHAQATILDVCDFAKKDFTAEEFYQADFSQIRPYIAKLKKECELATKYNSLNENLRTKHNINLTDVSEYQAIRFVQRSWLGQGEYAQKPVELIYQIFKTQYALPLNQQSGAIWDDWAVGIKQLEPVIESFKNGETFDLAALKKIHRGLFPFYPMIDEHGDFAHDPNPGVLKATYSAALDSYWWTLEKEADILSAKKVVEHENEYYQRLGLLTPAPKGLPDFVSHILDVRETTSRDGQSKVTALFSGSSVVNRQNVELILNMVDTLIKQARAGQPMIWKRMLFTPGELAYFVQQAYVRVHPFYEGNGRTSRFLQELILRTFSMPHGASGDLMDIDALTTSTDYYKTAIEANVKLLDKMQRCADEYDSIGRKVDMRQVQQSKLSYGCRVLADRSAIWNEMKLQNEVTGKAKYDQRVSELSRLGQTNDQNHLRELENRTKAGLN